MSLDLKNISGKLIIIGAVSDHKTAEYLRLLKIAEEKGYTLITSDEAREAGLNIPAEILPDHGISICDIKHILPLVPIEPLPDEFLIKNKRGKGKHKKKYDPPYRYHR